jgi:hypothetical protein
MSEKEPIRRKVVAALAAGVLFLGAGAFGLRWWESRVDRQSEVLAGIGQVLPGSVTDARKKVDPGRTQRQVLDAIGKPSARAETNGAERHAMWTYYYADGTLTLSLTDGYLARADLEYGPPRLGTPGHGE